MARSRPDVGEIIAALGPLPAPRPRPALVALVGLPGTGKSTLAAALRARTGAAVVESDAVRRLLFSRLRHTPRENAAVFTAVHAVVRELLTRGVDVVVDATSRREAERAALYRIAGRAGARLVIVAIQASEDEVRRRLEGRSAGADSDPSTAGIAVYERMRESFEPIRRPHHVVDTGRDTSAAVEAIAREIESA